MGLSEKVAAREQAGPEAKEGGSEVEEVGKAWLLAAAAVQVVCALTLAGLAVVTCLEMARVLAGTARATRSL